jgi:hypothetical protein
MLIDKCHSVRVKHRKIHRNPKENIIFYFWQDVKHKCLQNILEFFSFFQRVGKIAKSDCYLRHVYLSVRPSSVCLSVCVSVRPSFVCLSVRPSVLCMSVCPSVRPRSVCLSVRPSSVRPSVRPSVLCPSVRLSSVRPSSVCPSVLRPSVCPSSVRPSVLCPSVRLSVLCPSVRLSVCTEQLGSQWTDFHEILCLRVFRKYIEKIKFNRNMTRITGTVHEGLCTVMVISRRVVVRMRNVSDKSRRENQNTHFMMNKFPPNHGFYKIMRKNVVQPDRPQMTL